MFLFKDKKLASYLSDGLITQEQMRPYYIITGLFLLFSILGIFDFIINYFGKNLPWDYVELIAYLFLLLSIYLAFKINKNGDNEDFIKRYFALTVPITIKLVILTAPILIIAMVSDYFTSDFMKETVRLYGENPNLDVDNLPEEYQKNFGENFINATFGPFSRAAMLLISILTLWRYIVCFKIASGQTEYKK